MAAEVLARSAEAFTGLVLAPRPFEPDAVQIHAMPEGLSIAAMIERLEGDGALDRALRPWLRVVINDRLLGRDEWGCVPGEGDALVVEVAAMGKSNPLRTILQIAVVALATFVAVTFPGIGGALAAAAITIGGTMLVDAIAPIKQPELAQRQQRYSLDGASNAAAPHEAWPILMGRRRIYPRRCANWYTRTVDNVVYLRMMFQPGVSWMDHADPRIGETALSGYDGVTVRWRTRHDEPIDPIWFVNNPDAGAYGTPAEDGYGIPITSESGWVTRSAPMEADTLSIDVAFMAGLYETKESSGNPKNRTVLYEFRYGPRGGSPDAATPCPWTVGGVKSWTRDKLDAYREGFYWAVPRGDYDVHMRRVSPDNGNTAKISDELTLVCVRAFQNQAAVRDLTGKPWIEVEIKASEQLNGIVQDFSFIGTSIVPQATAEGPGAMIVTRNPADLYLAASYAPFSDVELDDEDERNFAAIAAWRAVCVAQGWNCDLAEAGEISVGELLQRIAAMGRARPTLDFGALSVVVDWAKPHPRTLFTPRNVSGFVGELNYPETVHGLRLRFQNEAKDYDDDLAVVFAPGFTIDNATRYSAVEVRDKTNLQEVEREGARMLAEAVLRPEKFTFEQDWEYVSVKEGERALLAHHVALVGQISARVEGVEIAGDGSGRKGLLLDELVVMQMGRSYDMAWRPSADAPLVTLPLETFVGQSDLVWFPLPAPATVPSPGDLVSIYEHQVELLDVVVNRISPAEGLKAEISCVPYAPELQALAPGEIPVYRTGAVRPPGLASAALVKRTERAINQVIDKLGDAVIEAGKGLDGIADGTGKFGGDRTVADVLGDLSQAIIDVGAEITRSELRYQALLASDGAKGTLIEQLIAQTAQNTAYITFLRQVDAETGSAKVVLATNVNGTVSGMVNANNGDQTSLAFGADVIEFVGDDPDNPVRLVSFNTETEEIELNGDVKVRGNLSLVDGTVDTVSAAENAWTAMQVSSASSTTYGSNAEVSHFSHILELEDDADVLFLAQINFQDGGGNSESYHASATRVYLNGELLDQNSQGKNNAVTALPVLTSRRLPAGTHTVALRSMCKPDDYYTSRTLVTFRAYR